MNCTLNTYIVQYFCGLKKFIEEHNSL